MSKRKVPLWQNPRGFAVVDTDATHGAVVGETLFNPDGSIWIPPAGTGGEVTRTIWSRVEEIPPNVTALAGTTSTGLYVLAGSGVSATRSLADSATIEWTNGSGLAGNPSASLKALEDTGGGTLLAIERDEYGRVAGTRTPTTTDLAEGVNLYFTEERADARISAQKGVAGGLVPLNGAAQIDTQYIPAAVLGQVEYKGSWDASSGTAPTGTPEKGWYYIVTVAGSTDLDGITQWEVGDWAIYNGGSWNKVDNTDAISSWNGRAGAVMPQAGDYTPAMVGAATAAQGAAADSAVQSIVAGTNITVDATDPKNPVVSAPDGGASLPPGYIDGLRMVWVSGTALTVTSGSAYIEGAGAVLEAPADIAKAGLTLSASTWYHVYLFDNAGTPDVEIVTDAPAAPYNGTARSKASDATRRYLGSVRVTGAGEIAAFRHSGHSIAYLVGTSGSPFRVLSNGTVAITETTVSAADAVPPTSTQADVRVVNQRNDTATFGTPDDNLVLTQASFLLRVPASSEAYPSLQLSTSQEFTYYLAGTSGGLYVDIRGYTFER